ncbi:MAG: hypothetical protein JEZ02_21705 [Desulfatibacillum sp.]|nr:hypothetical protein [Desulfatibacillum sp.]
MTVSDCIRASKSQLYDARRFLETGGAINWIPKSLEHAVYWAMQAWVMHNKCELRDSSSMGICKAFIEAASEELRSPISYCYSEAKYLEYDLMGSSCREEPLPPLDVWKKSAFECLDKAEIAIANLFEDIGDLKE